MAIKDLFFSIFAKDKTASGFNSVNRRLRETEGYAATLSERLDRTGRAMTRFGGAASATLTPVAFGMRGLIKASAEWEAALNRSNALLKPTTDQIADLEAVTRDLGRTTQFSAGQAADAVEMLARNGLSAAQILDGALASSLTAAAVGGAELADAADVVTDAMLSFNIPASKSAMVADELASTMSKSKMAFDDYRLALGQAGGVAGATGVSFDEFNTALAGTASKFATGANAGMSLKSFLTRLTPASASAAEAMDTLGFEAFDAEGNLRSLADISEQLNIAMSRLSEKESSAAFAAAFGNDALRTAYGLSQMGAAGFQDLAAAMDDVSSSDLAAARMEGATGALTRLSSAVNGLAVAIGASGLLDFFTEAVNRLTALVNWVGNLSPELLKMGAIFASVALVVAPLIAVLGLLTTAISAIGVPVAATIAGVTALTAAFVALWDDISEIGGKISELFAAMPQWARAMAQGVIDALALLISPFRQLSVLVEGAEQSFAWLYDRVVGNSWVPDLVDEIGDHFGRLKSEMVDPAEKSTADVDGHFAMLSDDVSSRLKFLARDGQITWRGFLGAMEDSAQASVDRITGQIFDKLADQAFSGIEGLIGGVISGGGGKSGGGFLSGITGGLGQLMGFDTGGSFTVAGRAGVDRNVAAMRLSEGENVHITRRGEATAPHVTINIQTPDVESFRRSRGQIAAQMRAAFAAGGRVA